MLLETELLKFSIHKSCGIVWPTKQANINYAVDFVRNKQCAVLVRQILRQEGEAWCLIERRRKPELFKNAVRCRRCWDHVTLVDLVFYQGGVGLESCRACVYVCWHTIDFRLSRTIGRWPKPSCLATKCHVFYWTLQTASR